MGEETTGRRLAVVLWSALAVEVVGLVGTFVLGDTTALVPEYGSTLLLMCAMLLAITLAVLPIVVAVLKQRNAWNSTAVWRAVGSWILASALLVMLVRAGGGPWVVWCAVAMAASWTATVLCTFGPTELPIQQSRAAAAIAVVALVVAACGSCSGPYTDYPGVWTASKDAASLTLTGQSQPGQGGQYTLQVGTCTEQGTWDFDHPQMSTSVQMWLHREGAGECIPGRPEIQVHIVGGNRAAPVIALPGLRLTKQ